MTTLLIVDDHAGFRRLARKLLERSGFDVVAEAETSAEALLAVRETRPDVVLLDIQLPDADGIDTAGALQSEPCPPRVVLISSRAASSYAGRVDRSPAVGFISKGDLSGPGLSAMLTAS